MNKTTTLIFAAIMISASFGAVAADSKIFEFTDAGLKFSWASAAAINEKMGTSDLLLQGEHKSVKFKAIIRKGAHVPASQTQYRLTSYFPGNWTQREQECGGKGWQKCSFWKFNDESNKYSGLAVTGYGPSGTYIITLMAPHRTYRDNKASMWSLLDSIELF